MSDVERGGSRDLPALSFLTTHIVSAIGRRAPFSSEQMDILKVAETTPVTVRWSLNHCHILNFVLEKQCSHIDRAPLVTARWPDQTMTSAEVRVCDMRRQRWQALDWEAQGQAQAAGQDIRTGAG